MAVSVLPFSLLNLAATMQGCKAFVVFCVNVGAFVDESDSDFGVTF